MKARTF